MYALFCVKFMVVPGRWGEHLHGAQETHEPPQNAKPEYPSVIKQGNLPCNFMYFCQ